VFDEFTCASAFEDDVLEGMGTFEVDEDMFKTINHFTFSGNQLVAFNADTKKGAPVSFQLVAIRADWTHLFFPYAALPLPLTPLWVDDHLQAITLEENRSENFNAALGNDVSGTNFDWQLWTLSVCFFTIVGGECDLEKWIPGFGDLSFSAERAHLGRKLLSRLQDTKDTHRRLRLRRAEGQGEDPGDGAMQEAMLGGNPEDLEFLFISGGLSLFGGTMYTDCNDGAAIVLRDFEFFEVVLNFICFGESPPCYACVQALLHLHA
ncbi:hypothetical protein THAOC_05507, partial [Thalassiosira oceanica]